MVKHIILWKLKEFESEDEKTKVLHGIKNGLEGLKGQIDGLIDIKVNINGLPSSTVDLMLDSTFTNYDALKGYSKNEKHLYVANNFVRPYTAVRSCMDFEI